MTYVLSRVHLAALGALLSTTGCSASGKSCGPGTHDEGGECVATQVTAGATGAGGSAAGGAGGSNGASGEAGAGGVPGCAQPLAFFRDADGDGYGAGQAVAACTSPGPGWVSQPGDCDDELASVHPGVTDYFGEVYIFNGVYSFDYNCDGTEEPDPSMPMDTGDMCIGIYPKCPTGFGYELLDASKPWEGYCGSIWTAACIADHQMCAVSIDQHAPPFRCH